MVDTKSSRYRPRGWEDRSEYQKACVCSADEEGELEFGSRVLLPSIPIAESLTSWTSTVHPQNGWASH